MAACGSLHHFFENPLPENPTLLESLTAWKQIKPRNPTNPSSFTEIFGELHFQEMSKSAPPSTPSKSSIDQNPRPSDEKLNNSNYYHTNNNDDSNSPSLDSLLGHNKNNNNSPSLDYLLGPSKTQFNSSGSKNSGSLQLCTEGLGFESSDDVEDSKNMKVGSDWSDGENGKLGIVKHSKGSWEAMGARGGFKKSRMAGAFPPPPITSMGRQGKPWFFFKSYRHEGRFVLREFKIPTQEFLHACREDGRLRLNFVVPDKENIEDGRAEGNAEEQEEEEEEKIHGEEDTAGSGIS
ncbi:uncharacterized protein LOC131235198 [Magnolia sinica]|uniref:uncharacterized protein LOC131235198 n=1 Tax=Magnolia sinica TaxID=86752 RepID=UPI002657B81F|nr:uncharacterized protein LOC131235198 [Magnolia sinica]